MTSAKKPFVPRQRPVTAKAEQNTLQPRVSWREERLWHDQTIDINKLPDTDGAKICKWITIACRVPEGKYIGHNVELLDWQIKLILDIYDNPHGTRRAILSFGRKNAKSVCLTTPVPTPDGWRTIGDINEGDFVFGSDGMPVRVLAVSKVFRNKRCYASASRTARRS